MAIHQSLTSNGVLEIVIDVPPVNAVDLAHLRELVAIIKSVEGRHEVHVVVLRAEGRGFSGGGDVKEVQNLEGFTGTVGHAELTVAASIALQSCPVPVVAAVHGYCIGLGVLLVGCCDTVLASTGTVFVLAEVDNGATVGAIQAIGLMPDKRLRTAMFTCEPITAEELLGYGTVHRIVEVDDLRDAAFRIADKIASKSPEVIRAAKRSINGSLGRDFEVLCRQELSYTFELNMTNHAAPARERFILGERPGYIPPQ